MSRSTFKVLLFLKRNKQKANGRIPLYCRITVDGKEARFGMKCDINPKYWDVKTGKTMERTTEAAKINALADNTKATLHNAYKQLKQFLTAKYNTQDIPLNQLGLPFIEAFNFHLRVERKMTNESVATVIFLLSKAVRLALHRHLIKSN
jgi:hypothetical protein